MVESEEDRWPSDSRVLGLNGGQGAMQEILVGRRYSRVVDPGACQVTFVDLACKCPELGSTDWWNNDSLLLASHVGI